MFIRKERLWRKIILILILLTTSAYADDYHEVTELQDCQKYRIRELSTIHKKVETLICYYTAYYHKDGKQIPIILAVQDGRTIILPSPGK